MIDSPMRQSLGSEDNMTDFSILDMQYERNEIVPVIIAEGATVLITRESDEVLMQCVKDLTEAEHALGYWGITWQDSLHGILVQHNAESYGEAMKLVLNECRRCISIYGAKFMTGEDN